MEQPWSFLKDSKTGTKEKRHIFFRQTNMFINAMDRYANNKCNRKKSAVSGLGMGYIGEFTLYHDVRQSLTIFIFIKGTLYNLEKDISEHVLSCSSSIQCKRYERDNDYSQCGYPLDYDLL